MTFEEAKAMPPRAFVTRLMKANGAEYLAIKQGLNDDGLLKRTTREIERGDLKGIEELSVHVDRLNELSHEIHGRIATAWKDMGSAEVAYVSRKGTPFRELLETGKLAFEMTLEAACRCKDALPERSHALRIGISFTVCDAVFCIATVNAVLDAADRAESHGTGEVQ